jgi:cytochrome c-type biogenesis protein CcmH
MAKRISAAYRRRAQGGRMNQRSRGLAAVLASALLSFGAPAQTPPSQQADQQAAPLHAMDANGQLTNPVLQGRFEQITHELRCLVCQNESIADSNVDLAQDLRRQVREMLVAGKSDAAIFQFMTDRYGEFVRFAPPLSPKTLLIWGAPFIMLLLGGAIIFRIVRQRSAMPLDE